MHESYLDGRVQFTALNRVKSEPLPVAAGVPQGLVLGPTFSIYLLMIC